MDPRDRLRSLLEGAGCTVCGAPLPADRIRILASREDLAFVELRCAACGADTLGMVTFAHDEDGTPVMAEESPYGEFGPADEARFAAGRPLEADDVLAVHEFLAGWRGDLRSLLRDPRPGTGPAS